MGQAEIKKGERLAWLADMVDADGTIGFYSRPSYNKRTTICNCRVRIVSVDEASLTEVAKILREDVGVDAKVATTNWKWTNKQPHIYYMVAVTRQDDVKVALYSLIPYLVGKKDQAQLLLKLLQNHRRRTSYTEEELAVVEVLKMLKQNCKKKAELAYGSPRSISSEKVR